MPDTLVGDKACRYHLPSHRHKIVICRKYQHTRRREARAGDVTTVAQICLAPLRPKRRSAHSLPPDAHVRDGHSSGVRTV
jgi:hypothetical protein